MSDKVKRAVISAQTIRPWSDFIPGEAFFSNDISEITFDENGNTQYSNKIDTSKLDALLEILKPLNLADENRNILINRTQDAVIDFFMSSSAPKRSDQKKKLEEFVSAMTTAAHAWSGLGHDLQDSLLHYLEKSAPSLKASENELFARLDRSCRIKQVLADDVRTAAIGAKGLIAILGADRSHAPPEYALCIRVCVAWHECVGKAPSLSRNTNERRGERIPTPFERFVSAAIAPHEIGERVVRDAVGAFVGGLGDKPSPKIG
jgi:hypothetical protein